MIYDICSMTYKVVYFTYYCYIYIDGIKTDLMILDIQYTIYSLQYKVETISHLKDSIRFKM